MISFIPTPKLDAWGGRLRGCIGMFAFFFLTVLNREYNWGGEYYNPIKDC